MWQLVIADCPLKQRLERCFETELVLNITLNTIFKRTKCWISNNFSLIIKMAARCSRYKTWGNSLLAKTWMPCLPLFIEIFLCCTLSHIAKTPKKLKPSLQCRRYMYISTVDRRQEVGKCDVISKGRLNVNSHIASRVRTSSGPEIFLIFFPYKMERRFKVNGDLKLPISVK